MQNPLALSISDQLGRRKLAVQDNSDGKSNLKKASTVASWESSQFPALTAFFLCVIKVLKVYWSLQRAYISLQCFLVPV